MLATASNSDCPAIDGASHDSTKTRPITRPSEREYRVRRSPRALAQAGESSWACSPTIWSSSDSVPALPISLDSGEPRWTSQTVVKP